MDWYRGLDITEKILSVAAALVVLFGVAVAGWRQFRSRLTPDHIETIKHMFVVVGKRALRPVFVIVAIVWLTVWLQGNLIIQPSHPISSWTLRQYAFAIALVVPLALLVYILIVEPRRWTRRVEQSRVDSITPGLQSGLIRKIDFDYLQKRQEGLKEDFLSHRDPTHGYVLRIQAEQDFCMDYDLASDELKQGCKAVEFLFKPESEEFPFYTIIKVHGQQPPEEVRLYCKPTEGTCPAPERDQRYLYSNGDIPEYIVHVPTDQLNDGWALMSIDLLKQVRDIAALEGREWELDELVTLRLHGKGIKGDVAYIGLYSEPVE